MSGSSTAKSKKEEVTEEPVADTSGAVEESGTQSKVELRIVESDGDQSSALHADSSVQNARFAPLTPGVVNSGPGSMDVLLDVDLDLSVELGRTSLPVSEVLQLGPGSIVELEKLAGEPVDIMVNGKLIAKGEVVVIDENFGVRVTEIASQTERLSQLA